MAKGFFSINYKKAVLDYAELSGSDAKSYREYEVSKSTFYQSRKAFAEEGEAGLMRKRRIARNHPRQLRPEVTEKILHLRRTYHLGPQRIAWYIERYHRITTSCSSVYRTLIRNEMRRLPKNVGRRTIHIRRYSKQVPGHHIHLDVKFLTLTIDTGGKIRRFQYTAIDDATRIRALKIYRRHNQENAFDFIDYVIEKFPFPIYTVRTAVVTSSRSSSTGTWGTRGFDIFTSNHVHRNSMVKSKNPVDLMERNSITF